MIDFEKSKDYLICVDSDGSVFDTQEEKHRHCFAPRWIEVFGLEEHYQEAMMIWLKTNLYSKARGINRFIALEKCLKQIENIGVEINGLVGYENWILLSNELSDKALMEQIRKVENECLEKALIWSLRANRSFNMLIDEVNMFDNVKKALRFADKVADVVCVSEANMDTLNKEWGDNDIQKYVKAIYGQEAGIPDNTIAKLLEKGYDKDKVIMIGDSPNDLESAKANGISFFPIVVGQEAESWAQFIYEASTRFLEGEYKGEYEDSLIETFEKVLE